MILNDAQEAEVDEENYFVSMTDMMVGLVFIFIIMLMYFALQFQDITDHMTGADRERAEILKQLQHSLKEKGVEVTIDTQNGILHLPDEILFDRRQSDLKPAGEVAIGKLADALSEVLPCYTEAQDGFTVRPKTCSSTTYRIESVYVEGHTDKDVLNGDGVIKNNLVLSAIRATNTFKSIIDRRHDVATRCSWHGKHCDAVLSVSGYGPERPVDDGDTPEAKQRNRRIDIRLTMVAPNSQSAIKAVSYELYPK
jgi:flagellar motor protein MotB